MNAASWAEAKTAELLFNAVTAMDDENNDINSEDDCECDDEAIEQITDALLARFTWITPEAYDE